MEHLIKDNVKAIEISGIRQFNDKANRTQGVLKLTIGEVDLPTPNIIKYKLIEAINNDLTKYTQNKGIPELRDLITTNIKKEYNVSYSTEEVILTVGTTEGLSIVIKTLVDEGDEVIIPTPGYVGYEPLITLEKGKVVGLDTTINNFEISKRALEEKITKRTKFILITNPNNPTGRVLSKHEMDVIVDVVKHNDVFLVVDEIYSEVVYEDQFSSFIHYQEIREKLIILNGYSKSHSMTGLRIGYLIANKNIIDHLVKVHQYYVTSASSISQYGALAAEEFTYSEMVKSLKSRRDYAFKRLQSMGLPTELPNGAFYLFPDISEFNISSEEFANKLLHQYKVAIIPGEYFLGNHKNYIRISYAVDTDTLKEALNRLQVFIFDLKHN